MLKNRHWILGAAGVLGALAAQGVAAQYYLGVEMGREHLSFKPEYSFVSGAPNRSFDDQANGSVGSVLAGYHLKSARDFSLDVQGRLSAGNAAWQMNLAEPASLKYNLPANVAISLLPSFHVSEKVALFAEGGLALGHTRERKSAVTTSRYDSEKWRPGIVAGFGMSLALDDRWIVRVGYRHTWYQNSSYDTYLANGTPVERVTSKVTQSMTSIGLVREF